MYNPQQDLVLQPVAKILVFLQQSLSTLTLSTTHNLILALVNMAWLPSKLW